MNKWIPYILLIAVTTLLVIQCERIKKLEWDLDSQHTDTVYLDKPFEPEPGFDHGQKPNTIIKYVDKPYPVEVKTVEYIHDTITIYLKDSTKIEVKPDFLVKYPNDDKLIQMIIRGETLDLSLMDKSGSEYTKVYDNIRPDLFDYNYVNQNLTFKRKPFFQRFSPVARFTLRPVKQLYDLDFGLKYNTSKFNYEAGINAFYYPNLKTGLGTDFYIQVSYDF